MRSSSTSSSEMPGATSQHLPVRMIEERLEQEYGLTISLGGIIGLLYRMTRAATPTYEQLQCSVRAALVTGTLWVSDETGWRESSQQPGRVPRARRRPPEPIWTVSTPQTVHVDHGRRTNEAIDGFTSANFGGTIVAGCYAAYDHFLTTKQRCWVFREPNEASGSSALDVAFHLYIKEAVRWTWGLPWPPSCSW